MIRYGHTQRSTVVVECLLAAVAVCLLAPVFVPSPRVPLLLVTGIFALSALLFSSLTIRITDRFLQWRFGPGLIRKAVPLEEIEGVEVTRTTVRQGWGIHHTSRGWLYNVSGFQAVAVTLKSGRQFLLGTDEPERLRAALRLTLS